jgi:hypothetical protein
MPWGDYGDILLTGMVCHRERENGLLQLERTGPFVPPIAVEWEIVVTGTFRAALQASALSGLTFRPVVKRHIVLLDWRAWDTSAAEPPEYPASFEPEDYILAKPHDPAVAARLGELWELVLGEHATTGREHRGPGRWDEEIYLVGASWDGSDWFRAAGVRTIYVSQTAKDWLEATVPEWVRLEEAPGR